jgi:GntR family transcriptional regulator
MFLHVDPANGLAIYEQIVRGVKFAVADGALAAGELAPSVREMARDLALNPNTVARAYQQLQTDQVLENVRGRGLAVARGAAERCRKERVLLIERRIAQVLSEAYQSGISAQQLRELIDRALAALPRKKGGGQ